MEFIILVILALLALGYLLFFFKRGLKGDCSCRAGTCHLDCRAKNSCKRHKSNSSK